MIIREKVRIGDQLVTLETGRIAKQAGGSCLVRAGDTQVLVTVCGMQETKPGQSFFPLSVEYQEKTYAAGKIPGGFFKREGKLRDAEVLTSRLIDRPCRPLFPEGYLSEVQIVATVMSYDGENPPDVLAMVGASAALHTSQIPWKGPIAGVRVGRVDGEWIANPTYKQIEEGDVDLIIAASRDAIVMVEGECEEISEEDMVDALMFGHKSVQATLDLIDRMQQAVGKTKWTFAGDRTPQILKDRVRQVGLSRVREACGIAIKHERSDAFKKVKKEVVEILAPEFPDAIEAIKAQYEELKYNTMRAQVLEDGRRLDGRDTRTVRPISIELGPLARTHGSSLFTRGETQAIVTTTLGTARDQQRIDTLRGDVHKRFLLHYNFPPYSVGEVKPMRGPGRREVGHGNLAERALAKLIPDMSEFPYSIRIVSEITESNGSSSMASVCGGSLALMDAGVPIKSPVAGVAMGLIKEGDDYAILTDILGDEDALGDMDFKVCGTEKGITAIQMDIKIEGLSRDILERALSQALEARIHILGKMAQAIRAPREELSRWAPRITQIRVKPDQIRTIIGPGGKMIRAIVDQTGASIDVEDDGTVNVSSADSEAVKKALEIIKSLTTEPEIGESYEGVVKRIEPYGAFIEIMPGKDGLCHISDIDYSHVQSVEEFMNLGDKVKVKVTNIDREGRIRLSRKEAMGEPEGGAPKVNGRSMDREDRPRGGRDREERGGFRGRGRDRDERPRRDDDGGRDKPSFKTREDRDEKPSFKTREDRDEKPSFKTREDRDEKPSFKTREDRDEKPSFKARDEERPSFKTREDRPRARDEEREERPAFKSRLRDEDERPAFKPREERGRGRDEEREERPAFKSRPRDEDERPAFKSRDERSSSYAGSPDAVRPPRDAFKSRDEEREERPAFKAREDRFDRDERPAKAREDRFDRDERSSWSGSPDAARPPRDAAKPREDRFESRGRDERKPVRDDKPAAREDRFESRSRDERRPGGRASEDVRGARDEEPREDRFARGRDAARPARDERPAREDKPRVRDEEPREDRFTPRSREAARPARDERPARDDKPRVRDDDRFESRSRDERRPVRDEGDERPSPRGRRDEEPRADRPRSRDDDRFESRGRESDVLERKPARRGGEDEDRFEPKPRAAARPAARAAEDAPRPARDDRDDDRFDDRSASAQGREDRTERERPSRSRARARTRDRVREDERERERR
jgi:polyribonucleotide nucleotidyltransferase